MGKELSRVAEHFGTLTSVSVSEFESGWVESIRFGFDRGSLTVSVDGDDDTVRWDLGPSDVAQVETPTEWQRVISSQVRWIWELRNHRGFADGLQIEFSHDGEDTDIQIMAEASRLRTYRLDPFPSNER